MWNLFMKEKYTIVRKCAFTSLQFCRCCTYVPVLFLTSPFSRSHLSPSLVLSFLLPPPSPSSSSLPISFLSISAPTRTFPSTSRDLHTHCIKSLVSPYLPTISFHQCLQLLYSSTPKSPQAQSASSRFRTHSHSKRSRARE